MSHRLVQTVAAALTAIGTIAVAILAIWIDYFKTLFAGPQLGLSLFNPLGDLTQRSNRTRTYYFHLSLENDRGRAPAEGVRVLVEGISKRRTDGSFFQEPLVYPLQLIWTPMEFAIMQQVIFDAAACDFGFLDQGTGQFILATVIRPNNFRGYIAADEAMRVQVAVSAKDVRRVKPLVIEVAWDGNWSADPNQMQRHLLVKEVKTLT